MKGETLQDTHDGTRFPPRISSQAKCFCGLRVVICDRYWARI